MIALDAALALYAAELRPLPVIHLAPAEALGRVLAEPALAATDLPRLDQSAMDGYAIRAADTAGGGEHSIELRVVTTIAAAAQPALAPLARGTAARIFTGGLIPPGADTVIAQERVQRIEDRIVVNASWPVGRNVRRRGEELRTGTALAQTGQRIGAGLLASLINGEVAHVAVRRAPRVAILVNGDEIKPAGTPLRPGEIHDSNGPLCRAVLASRHCEIGTVRHVGDDEAAVCAALAEAFATHDLVISCGGASVGDKDFLPAAAESLGVRRVFWKVAQKPAKPLFFGVLEREGRQLAMLALPGNPGAVLISLLLHVQAALDALEAVAQPGPPWSQGLLLAPVERDRERTRLLRMRLGHDEQARAVLAPLPNQDSHMLSNLGHADVLVRVEAGDAPVAAGALLPWLPMSV